MRSPHLRQQARNRRPALQVAFRPTYAKIIGLAAALLLCFGLGYLVGHPFQADFDAAIPITLASAPGSLSDDQFLTLTRHLLSADLIYHQRMYLILSALHERYPADNLGTLMKDQSAAPARIIPADGSDKSETIETYKF